jgi:head-tail adaptor
VGAGDGGLRAQRYCSGQPGAVLRHRIVIRARTGIGTRHRLRDGAHVYRIVAVRESDGRRFLEIEAEERED